MSEVKSQHFWWEAYDGETHYDAPVTMTIEASEVFPTYCGFVKLRERHRVKAKSVKYTISGKEIK